MKKLRTQHAAMEDELDKQAEAHRNIINENVDTKKQLTNYSRTSEMLEQAELVKENLKSELADAMKTIKQLKISDKTIQKELTQKKTEVSEITTQLDNLKASLKVIQKQKYQ